MARFKVGEKIVLNDDGYVSAKMGSVGIVQDEDIIPEILFENGVMICVDELDLEPYTDPASEIAQIVENSINSIEHIPVDRFEFTYKDEYGRTLSHKFEQSEGDYDLCDVIASFRLFILGIGWGREVVYKYIREDRL